MIVVGRNFGSAHEDSILALVMKSGARSLASSKCVVTVAHTRAECVASLGFGKGLEVSLTILGVASEKGFHSDIGFDAPTVSHVNTWR